MFIFDACVFFAAIAILFFNKVNFNISKYIIFYQMVLQIAVSSFFIYYKMYEIIAGEYLFIAKALILFLSIVFLHISKAETFIVSILFLQMVYQYLTWYEYTVKNYFIFYSFYKVFIGFLMIVQLVYMAGGKNGFELGESWNNLKLYFHRGISLFFRSNNSKNRKPLQ